MITHKERNMDNGSILEGKPQEVSVAAMLEAISCELGTLGAGVEHIQEVLSPALTQALLTNPGAMIGLQELDRVAQTLQALSGIVSRMVGVPGLDQALDIQSTLAAVPLAELAARLHAA
jgi:hypothetical protein